MTRRGLLAFESRIFDPLGILEPFKLPAKLILRNLAKMGFDWDDKNLPPDIMVRWDCWVRHLNRLDGVSLPRHHFNLHKAKTVELHGFATPARLGTALSTTCEYMIEKTFICRTLLESRRCSLPYVAPFHERNFTLLWSLLSFHVQLCESINLNLIV